MAEAGDLRNPSGGRRRPEGVFAWRGHEAELSRVLDTRNTRANTAAGGGTAGSGSYIRRHWGSGRQRLALLGCYIGTVVREKGAID